MLNKISLCGCCIDHIFFIHSSISGPLGWFHVIAVVNSTAISVGVRGWVVCVNSVTCTPRLVVTRHIWARSLVFWKQSTLISVAAAAVCAPTISVHPTSFSDLILVLSFGLIATATGARWNVHGRTVIFFLMNKSYMLMWRLEVNPRCHSSGDVVTSVCLRQAFSPGPWLISESQRSTCLHLANTELQAQTTTVAFDAFRCLGLNSDLRPRPANTLLTGLFLQS